MKIELNELLRFSRRAFRKTAFANNANPSDWIPFTDTLGIHIYADLRLELALSAPDNLQRAQRYLEILQAYATSAEAMSHLAGYQILEVQGTRLHLYREVAFLKQWEIERTVRACRVFYALATLHIGQIARNTDYTIRMAADWGRAILLLSSGEDESESVVSLGVPANRPAKHLARPVGKNGVPAGYIAVNTNAMDDPYGTPDWELFDLEQQVLQKSAEPEVVNFSAANDLYENLANSAALATNRSFEPNPQNPVSAPRRRQGFMFRADLDGFSNRILRALQGTQHDVLRLVHEFHAIMQFPVAFKDRLPEGVKVLPFPWAGDCANLLLESGNYNFDRAYLPNIAALQWHDQARSNGTSNWRGILADTKWLIAIAGGDNHGADHGYILTGNVIADSRTFHVGAGWGWQRSLDAEQSAGTSPEDTVIQMEDYEGLEESYKPPFREHRENPTLFKVAPYDALHKNSLRQSNALRVSSPAIVVATSALVPAPRPYGE